MGCRGFIAFILNILNFFQTFFGAAMIIYSAWMLRQWDSFHNYIPNSFTSSAALGIDLPAPWFIYTFMGIGIIVCVVSCSGHIAAETTNWCCLCCYTVLVFLLILLEAAFVGDIFFNPQWDKDIPDDPTGEFENIKEFIESNIDSCKWVGLGIVIVQVLSLLFAVILRIMVSPTTNDYDSDDDYYLPRTSNRQPLLIVQSSSTPVFRRE
ncbi:tetraspanin-20 [Cryptomeria japonica]|uniref:tetraspanin-20 n=1 Tax=Cryptomeria japonica TaxID=3369 RepID=UPI0025ACCABE|nr:tetraspanin-20 [Cryptomeria japonica]XP_057865828.1 tetraspanin-20 [Cryptomeria japonica]